MKTVQHAIEVAVPLHTAFEQLSHLQNYPRFMTGVKQVTQLSDTRAHWVMELNGQRQEFDAEITECREDERVAWRSTGTPELLSEVITLQSRGDNRTHITAELMADAQALLPSDAHAEESLSRLLKADLNRFKQYAEQHPQGDLPQSATARTKAKMAGGGSRAVSPATMAQNSGGQSRGTRATGIRQSGPAGSAGSDIRGSEIEDTQI